MKMRFLLVPLLMVCATPALVFRAGADPILPYQQPILQQLNTDIGTGTGDTKTLNRALDAYQRTSKSLNSDIGILRDLESLLRTTPNYPALLADAVNAYLADFQGRRDALGEQLRPAPRSTTRTSAQTLLGKIDAALLNAETNTVMSQRIARLQTAAAKIPPASNTIQRALKTKSGLSSMSARIGALKFQSARGGITGGTFEPAPGNVVGEFGSNGVLTFSAFDNGAIARALHLHVEGISSNTPATYPLGVEQNTAFYDATEVGRRREYHFGVAAWLSNSIVGGPSLTVDYIGTNYMLGRFAFIGTNASLFPNNHLICTTNQVEGTNVISCVLADTNTTATISQGEFQLNFNR
ncbi:MAG TPA: hypothetical protein VNT99_13070 [Methylomirabilota bacterium]|nr:hypothetical protein [Methylomirabilota bacterium]